MLDPSRDVLLEAYLSSCPMCMCLAPRVRMLGQLAAAHFPRVRVAVMNVDDNDRPLDWMPGPAFPTIQLFNAAAAAAGAPASAATAAAPPQAFCKLSGAACVGGGPAAPALPQALAAVAAAGARTTLAGTPPCVPAVDFTHPSAPGKMAVPTVVELLNWTASHCSRPFDPAAVPVDAAEIRGSAQRFADMLPPEAAATAPAVGAPPSLLSLARDMDAEARVLEVAVFDLFYYEHMAATAAKALGEEGESSATVADAAPAEPALPPPPPPPAWREGAPLPSLAAPERAARRGALGAFRAQCVERLRRAATEAAGYGGAEEAHAAMGACGELGEALGVRELARAYSRDAEEGAGVRKAARLAAELR